MKIPKPIVDEYFEKIIEHFDLIMTKRIFEINDMSMYPTHCRTPYYIIEILRNCIAKNEIGLIEYIMYLKLCKQRNIIHFWTKKEKNIIIQIVKEKYNNLLDLRSIKTYLDRSYEFLAFELRYEIGLERDIFGRYALRIKEGNNNTQQDTEREIMKLVVDGNSFVFPIGDDYKTMKKISAEDIINLENFRYVICPTFITENGTYITFHRDKQNDKYGSSQEQHEVLQSIFREFINDSNIVEKEKNYARNGFEFNFRMIKLYNKHYHVIATLIN